jgi:hypothetical protein
VRGPLFSGPIGHKATVARVAALVGTRRPVVVLSNVWLAEAVCRSAGQVNLLVEPAGLRAGLRARRRHERDGRKLDVAVAGEDLPLGARAASALIVDSLLELDEEDGAAFVADLVPFLNPGGLLVALDGTKDPAHEARVAGWFLAGALIAIGQERPREGAVLTSGRAPALAPGLIPTTCP